MPSIIALLILAVLLELLPGTGYSQLDRVPSVYLYKVNGFISCDPSFDVIGLVSSASLSEVLPTARIEPEGLLEQSQYLSREFGIRKETEWQDLAVELRSKVTIRKLRRLGKHGIFLLRNNETNAISMALPSQNVLIQQLLAAQRTQILPLRLPAPKLALEKKKASESFTPRSSGIFITSGDELMYTSDRGKKWKFVHSFPRTDITSIHMVNPQEIFGVGPERLFGYSLDGGKNWNKKNLLGFTECMFLGIHFVNSNEGYIYGIRKNRHHFIAKTLDRGKSWSSIWFPLEESPIKKIEMPGTEVIFVLAKSGSLMRSLDKGISWYNKSNISPIDFDFLDDRHGFAITSGRNLYYTENSGASWKQTIDLPSFSGQPTWIKFVNNEVGYIGTDTGSVLRTNNGGIEWKFVNTLKKRLIKGDFWSESDGLILAEHQQLYLTQDGGGTFRLLSTEAVAFSIE